MLRCIEDLFHQGQFFKFLSPFLLRRNIESIRGRRTLYPYTEYPSGKEYQTKTEFSYP